MIASCVQERASNTALRFSQIYIHLRAGLRSFSWEILLLLEQPHAYSNTI